MNPSEPSRPRRAIASSNIYTAFLGITLGILVAYAALVAFQCLSQYGTLFSIPQ